MTARDTYAELDQARADMRRSLQQRSEVKPATSIASNPSPSRTSTLVGRLLLGMVIGGLVLVMCTAARASEQPPPRTFILWDETRDIAWLSPKGLTATSTTATACALATVEAARMVPAGTRLSCRKVPR